MKKVTMKELVQMARTVYADDVTNITTKQFEEISDDEGGIFETIANCHNMFGCIGKLLRGSVTGKYYVITGRSKALIMF